MLRKSSLYTSFVRLVAIASVVSVAASLWASGNDDATSPLSAHNTVTEESSPDGSVDAQSDGRETHSPLAKQPYVDGRNYPKEGRIQSLHRQARLAAKTKDYATAEQLYSQLPPHQLSAEENREVLLEMADMYDEANVRSKLIAIYEKFSEENPQDPLLPEIYVRLGRLYREIGAFKMAVTRFYNVLNASLAIPREDIESYKLLSLTAQREIAETYFLTGDYQSAAKFFSRLKLLDLDDEERAGITFKSAYAKFLLANYPAALADLQGLIDRYPESPLVAEAHSIRANCFRSMNQPREAVAEALVLLRYNQRKHSVNREAWLYWQKRTGNQLANELYEQADFVNALKLYQAMAKLSREPDWQWSVIYQIGLCFERLRMPPKAREAFTIIAESTEWEDGSYDLTDSLKTIQEMARWHLDQLKWTEETEARVARLLDSVTSSI